MSWVDTVCDHCGRTMLGVSLDSGLVIDGYRLNVDGVMFDLCPDCYGAFMADRLDSCDVTPSGTVDSVGDLPGMWEQSDFTGGRHG